VSVEKWQAAEQAEGLQPVLDRRIPEVLLWDGAGTMISAHFF